MKYRKTEWSGLKQCTMEGLCKHCGTAINAHNENWKCPNGTVPGPLHKKPLTALDIIDVLQRNYPASARTAIVRAVNAHEELLTQMKMAINELGKDWQRCDEETGRECLGDKCKISAHRVVWHLEQARAKAEGK